MDTLQTADTTRMTAQRGPLRLRIAPPGVTDALDAVAAETATLGFDALVLPCPWAQRHGLLADPAQADAAYGGGPVDALLARLAGMRGGIDLLVDLPLDSVAAGAPLQEAHPDWFLPPDIAGVLDPRQALDLSRARLRHDDAAAVAGYTALLAGLVADLRAVGIAGVRLVHLGHLPASVTARALAAIRDAAGDALLVGDTRGMDWALLGALPADLLDAVVASNAFWDWRASWLFEELRLLRRVAPPLLTVDASIGANLAREVGLAAALGAGWIVAPTVIGHAEADTLRVMAGAIAAGETRALFAAAGSVVPLTPPGATVLAALRSPEADARQSASAVLTLLNTDPAREMRFDPATVLPDAQDMFAPFRHVGGAGETLRAGRPVVLPPGGLAVFTAPRLLPRAPAPLDPATARTAAETLPRVAIENPRPAVDGGEFPVKRIAGEIVPVSVDIIVDGHDKIAAAVQWRAPGAQAWEEQRLVPAGNDLWRGTVPLDTVGLHHWRVVAWRDQFATFRDELAKKHEAGVPTSLELREGAELVRATLAGHAEGAALLLSLDRGDEDARRQILLSDETNALMMAADPRPHLSRTAEIPLDAERTGAGFASWYEVFPRSMSDDPHRHGTFRDVERHLPRIRDMGFDVLYFPPIHPIGRTNRKGPNNTLTPGPDDPGSPYAIGSAEGGHDALHPELGSFADFAHLREAAAAHGLEIAIDFAIQCAPDHPWLREHKGWFTWRPDGTIRYAENPPKKYQDIVNVDFYAADAVPDLWVELARVVLFWCDQGVRLFRVDNPHTKVFPFWQWMIAEVRARHPDAVFLAEAFTRPKIMARLAKVGFSQSYTYFTWRNTKSELREYLTELADGPGRDYYRPHFFVNTPDINPLFLQNSGRPGFLIRAALAATLSGLWGVYNGFELCEGTPLGAGKEEYLDSEKFQIRAWDWDRPGNIVAEITALNRIRRANPALHSHLGVWFGEAANSMVLWYEKANADRSNVLLIAVSLDPSAAQTSPIELPLYRFGLPDGATLDLEDLLEQDRRFALTGKYQTITLAPSRPYSIWRVGMA